jgi:SAM-dependent methyltransferase
MQDRGLIDQRMRDHYEAVWSAGDAWEFESSSYEQERFARQVALIDDRRYPRVLEIGCGSGCFTQLLAGIAGELTALDISSAAIERARSNAQASGARNIDFRTANIMEHNFTADEPWDLVILSETIYCLGWLYSFFEIGMLASNLLAGMRPGGRLLLANTYGGDDDWLMRPWLIDTYRDLFRNVGFELESETQFQGLKDDCPMRVLMSLFMVPKPLSGYRTSGSHQKT